MGNTVYCCHAGGWMRKVKPLSVRTVNIKLTPVAVKISLAQIQGKTVCLAQSIGTISIRGVEGF